MDAQTKEILIEMQEQIKVLAHKIHELNSPPIDDGFEESIDNWFSSINTDIYENMLKLNPLYRDS